MTNQMVLKIQESLIKQKEKFMQNFIHEDIVSLDNITDISYDDEEIEFQMPTLIRQYAYSSVDELETTPPSPTITEASKNIYHEKSCPICFERDEKNSPLMCGHVFCNCCIQTMLEQSKLLTCPICRAIQEVNSVQHLQSLRYTIK